MYNSADRISELPLEILASIVCLLPLKEAVATSVLSRHWRHVWASTLTLDFDPEKTLFGFTYLSRTLQDKKSRRYVNWINRVIEQHNGPNIESFRACFDLDCRFTSSIDKWIEFALKKRVQVFVLDFVKIYGFNKDAYAFPRKLLGLEKEFASNHYVGFKYLKVVYFDNVDVTGEIIEYFLSHYPVLERLSVSFAKS
ncbi:F-box/LRR-repeat protein At3g03360-like [Prunus dulcis]|uniref:F-box/LRR-repeat protein At3g03360-like n=1 Tax=Prunus dulcis TaxID=3755 RepID=UPI001481DDDC|nr:F-box/LRR-repeat protein At3g03360-like [Prunus dulcis]